MVLLLVSTCNLIVMRRVFISTVGDYDGHVHKYGVDDEMTDEKVSIDSSCCNSCMYTNVSFAL